MKVELKDLGFIDAVAMAIISSKLSNMNMSQDQIESLASSGYRYATLILKARENFKKEHGIVEELDEEISNPTVDDLKTAMDKFNLEDKEYTVYVATFKEGCKKEEKIEEKNEIVEENKEIEEKVDAVENTNITVSGEFPTLENEEVVPPKRRGRPIKASKSPQEGIVEKPKRGRKPKAILKINKILDKK